MRNGDHYAALDGLRGIAAVSVLLFHLGQWQGQPWMASNARLAVDFFFALSGYVLSVAYSEKLCGSMSAWAFVKLRLIRLMPIIIIATLISAAYLIARVVLLDDRIDLEEIVFAAFLGVLTLPFFSASVPIGGPQVFPLNGPQYTLFLELVVNIFWAVTRRVEALWIALAIMAISYVFTAIYGADGDTVSTFWTGFPRVFGAYYAGVAIYYVRGHLPASILRHLGVWFWPLFLTMLFLFYWPYPVSSWMTWVWSGIFSPMLVLTGSCVNLPGVTKRVSLMLGEISYPLYALHYPIFVWTNGMYQYVLGKKDYIIGSTIVFPSAIIGSWIILKLLDEPIRTMLASLRRRRSVRDAGV